MLASSPSISARGPTSATSMPNSRAACTAPAIDSVGARSPPRASSAIITVSHLYRLPVLEARNSSHMRCRRAASSGRRRQSWPSLSPRRRGRWSPSAEPRETGELGGVDVDFARGDGDGRMDGRQQGADVADVGAAQRARDWRLLAARPMAVRFAGRLPPSPCSPAAARTGRRPSGTPGGRLSPSRRPRSRR